MQAYAEGSRPIAQVGYIQCSTCRRSPTSGDKAALCDHGVGADGQGRSKKSGLKQIRGYVEIPAKAAGRYRTQSTKISRCR